jgi:hypothetical protein
MIGSLRRNDALAVVLLAMVGHPDRDFRRRLTRWLDAVIAERGPFHTEQQVRSFLRRPLPTSVGPLVLDPPAREIAVRLLRLVFAVHTSRVACRWLRLVRTALRDDAGGVMISRHLQTMRTEDFLRCERHKVLRATCSLAAGMIVPRLRQFQEPDTSVQVTCRVGPGFNLSLTGKLPWKYASAICARSTLGPGKRLDHLGVGCVEEGAALRLQATTPEATIAFSAALLRGDRLVLRGPGLGEKVIVTLRDFEGEETELPAEVHRAGPETWLARAPGVTERLDEEDAVEVARWLYPPESWSKAGPHRQFWEKVLT